LTEVDLLRRFIQQEILESDSANRAAIEPIRTDDQQFLAGKGSDRPIELDWRSVTGLHFDPRSALADGRHPAAPPAAAGSAEANGYDSEKIVNIYSWIDYIARIQSSPSALWKAADVVRPMAGLMRFRQIPPRRDR
jgi:hypothetical protein